ncbi:MAG: hypothetical protein ABIF82_10305 [Planctomycetota bacterium]
MTDRDKKLVKLLSVLGPVLLLAGWHGYSQVQSTKARRAKRGQQVSTQAPATAKATEPAAAPDTKVQPSPPPGVQPADKRGIMPAAASQGVRVVVDAAAQGRREKLPWGRDPFTPPDTQAPQIGHLSDIESPRGKTAITVQVHISDRAAGNSGVKSAVLRYGTDEPYDRHAVKGTPPASENGDGVWTFSLPAPEDRSFGCFIVADDAGRLRNQAHSSVFKVIPPLKESVQAHIGGTDVKLTLRGISWTGNKGVVLINNDVLAEGEYIQGYEIRKIAKNGVVLVRNGQEVFLQLKE